MRKAALVLAIVVAAGMMAGCTSVPEWVAKGSGAFPGDRGSAIYAVGIGAPDPNPSMRRNMARADARAELSRTSKAYVAELTKNFMQKHTDYYDMEGASSIQFFSQAGKQVTDATIRGSQEIDSWVDTGGKLGTKGTLYLLMILPLDNPFFDQAKQQYDALIRQYKAKVLKVEADQALKELDAELEKARQEPFGLTGPVMPPPPTE